MEEPVAWPSALLPITVIAAIVLFVLKEGLEAIRRWRADRRKLGALRKLLARECELNLWSMRSIRNAIAATHEALQKGVENPLSIFQWADGREHFRVKNEKEGWGGGLFPVVRRAAMDAAIVPAAELDRKLFDGLESALEAVAELDHLRGSLISYADESNPESSRYLQGFVEWALEQFDDVEQGLNKLYVQCTKQKLERARLR